jgi:hypothetical protein
MVDVPPSAHADGMTQQYFASSAFIEIIERRQQRADDRRLARVERAATQPVQRTGSTAQISRAPRPTIRFAHLRHLFHHAGVAH